MSQRNLETMMDTVELEDVVLAEICAYLEALKYEVYSRGGVLTPYGIK